VTATHAARLPELGAAVARALRFLAQSMASTGRWTDFASSDEWVTAFVGANLSATREAVAFWPRLTQTLRRLGRPDGCLGYAGGHPPDCDSTAWLLLAAQATGAISPLPAAKAIRFLLHHQDQDSGGFCTYRLSSPGAHHLALPERMEWFAPAPCVTAVATLALVRMGLGASNAVNRGVEFLERCRRADGTWSAYWWEGAAYTTHFATVLLRLLRRAEPAREQQAVEQLTTAGEADSVSPFDRGLTLLTLLLRPEPRVLELARRLAERLLADQRSDGSFGGQPLLRVPHHAVGSTLVRADRKRVFTTSLVIRALCRHTCVMGAWSSDHGAR
jgi:hypothetical protein